MDGVNIHFLNVGIGDCIIVHFPYRVRKDGKTKEERIMMIDLYHHDSHYDYENVIEYYKENFRDASGKVKPIFRFICTHPHKDHIGGLAKLFQDNDIDIWNIWDLEHSFYPEEFEDDEHEQDWETYEEMSNTSVESPKTIITSREDTPRLYWNDDEDRITILSPSEDMIKEAHKPKEDGTERKPHEIDIDYISYALLLRINSIKVIFGGDGNLESWEDIYNNCKDDIKNSHILKAPHHGHKSAFYEPAVKLINPDYIIFSNSEEMDKKEGAEEEYSKAVEDSTIFKTCNHGTIIANVGWDGEITFYDKENNVIA